jgi:hypothetical protein
MTRPVRTELPPWLSTGAVARMGAAMALLAIVLAGGFAWYQQRELQERELLAGELLARVLEDHANRSFNTVDIALGALAETLHAILAGSRVGRPVDIVSPVGVSHVMRFPCWITAVWAKPFAGALATRPVPARPAG